MQKIFRWVLNVVIIGLIGAISVHSFKSEQQTAHWFSHYSYYGMLALFAFWLWSLCHVLIKDEFSLKSWAKENGLALAFSFILTCIIFISSPPYLRVLSDETNLISVSQSMTFDKTVDNVTMGKWYYHNFNASNREIPKRPLLYPFFVHLAHTLTGYRAENAYAVNFLTLFALFSLIVCRLRKWLGNHAAYLAALFCASQPVLIQTATSGGFDQLCVFFMLLSGFALKDFFEKPSAASFHWLFWNLAMLAQARHESILIFTITLSMLLIFKQIKRTYLQPLWMFLVSPLLFLPRVWQHLLASKIKDQFETPEGVPAFAINHFFNHAITFFRSAFDFNFYLPYAPLINSLGVIGLIVFIARNKTQRALSLSHVIIGMNVFAVWVVLLSFHMGDPGHPASIRYFPLFFILLSVSAAAWLNELKIFIKTPALLCLLGVLGFAYYHPHSIENRFMNSLFLPREYRIVMDFLTKQTDRNILVIADRPGQFTVHHYGAVNFSHANEHAKDLLLELERHLFSDIYVIQEILYETQLPSKETTLSDEYSLTAVLELQNKAESFVRVSKVKRFEQPRSGRADNSVQT